jgi:hypothetical protein
VADSPPVKFVLLTTSFLPETATNRASLFLFGCNSPYPFLVQNPGRLVNQILSDIIGFCGLFLNWLLLSRLNTIFGATVI